MAPLHRPFRKASGILIFLLICACAPKIMTPPIKTLTPKPTLTLFVSPTATVKDTPHPASHKLGFDVFLLSPDGTKMLQSMDWINYEILNTDEKVLWSFSYEQYKGGSEEILYSLQTGLVPLYWSLNGKEIYFAYHHASENSSIKYFGNSFFDGSGVLKFDVETGEMAEIVRELPQGYYAVAISPDGSQLVYANQNETPVKIILLDLKTNQERVLFVAEQNILEIGSFGWSPKMDQLLFMTLEINGDTNEAENRIYNIFVMDMGNLRIRKVIENINFYLDFDSWNDQGLVFFKDIDHSAWQLKLNAQELNQMATPTP